MNKEVASLSPSILWTHFEELNAVPRASKKEERVIAFIKDFGKKLNLEVSEDKTGNVIIRKPATAGMENRKGVVLQAHLDMVHQKNSDTQFDFDTQGIQSYIDGDWVKAKGTTLGADNGIGVAAAMAVLSSTDVAHGPIEALFTIDEETGMTGAFGLEGGLLQGDILLNMDTEDEHELCIGCAGGIDTNVSFDYQEVYTPEDGVAYKVSLTGLKGGHSGGEIHLGRGNANKLMNRLLFEANKKFDIRVASIDGGSLRNAIPRESFCIVDIASDNTKEFEAFVKEMEGIFQQELHSTEPTLSIFFEKVGKPEKVMAKEDQDNLIRSIYACPVGVLRMSNDIEGLVETSTSLARIKAENGHFIAQSLTRSSVETAKFDTANQIESAFKLAGAEVEHTGSYPGWTPNPHSEIVQVMKDLHQEMFGSEAIVNAVHAGLECGILGRNYPNMDMISFGPTIKNPHSPDEMCEINTVDRFWDYLKLTLNNIPQK